MHYASGGAGLATQSESLAVIGCQEPGKVRQFAEIVAGMAECPILVQLVLPSMEVEPSGTQTIFCNYQVCNYRANLAYNRPWIRSSRPGSDAPLKFGLVRGGFP